MGVVGYVWPHKGELFTVQKDGMGKKKKYVGNA